MKVPQVYGAVANTIHVWTLESGSSTMTAALEGHHSAVTALQVTHSTNHLVRWVNSMVGALKGQAAEVMKRMTLIHFPAYNEKFAMCYVCLPCSCNGSWLYSLIYNNLTAWAKVLYIFYITASFSSLPLPSSLLSIAASIYSRPIFLTGSFIFQLSTGLFSDAYMVAYLILLIKIFICLGQAVPAIKKKFCL